MERIDFSSNDSMRFVGPCIFERLAALLVVLVLWSGLHGCLSMVPITSHFDPLFKELGVSGIGVVEKMHCRGLGFQVEFLP